MLDTSAFTFLGVELLNAQLSDFASFIRDHFPQTVSQNDKLSSRLDKFSNRENTWPRE